MTRARILADYVAGGTTAAEFDYMDGVTSNVQTQLDAKLALAGGTMTGDLVPATPLSHRNMIINGDMRVSQRGTSGSASSTPGYVALDRYGQYMVSDGSGTISQDAESPVGFKNSLKFVTGSADSSLDAGQRMIIYYRCEGQDVAHLEYGTANAKTCTLSFYVRSSLTGTFGGAIGNGSDNRGYPFTYAISSANTWERKTVTFAGDTTGTWATDNGRSLQIVWGLGVGSTYSGTAGSWAGSDLNSATGAVSVIGTASATWYLTGVQLELGSNATPFEHRSYGEELARCQRYYASFGNGTSGAATCFHTGAASHSDKMYINYFIPVKPRAVPTVTMSGQIVLSNNYNYDVNVSTPTILDAPTSEETGGRVRLGNLSSLTVGQNYGSAGTSGSGKTMFSMEL